MEIGTVQSLKDIRSGVVNVPWPWLRSPDSELAQRVAELERKVARLETQQRRWPKRKRTGGRR